MCCECVQQQKTRPAAQSRKVLARRPVISIRRLNAAKVGEAASSHVFFISLPIPLHFLPSPISQGGGEVVQLELETAIGRSRFRSPGPEMEIQWLSAV